MPSQCRSKRAAASSWQQHLTWQMLGQGTQRPRGGNWTPLLLGRDTPPPPPPKKKNTLILYEQRSKDSNLSIPGPSGLLRQSLISWRDFLRKNTQWSHTAASSKTEVHKSKPGNWMNCKTSTIISSSWHKRCIWQTQTKTFPGWTSKNK